MISSGYSCRWVSALRVVIVSTEVTPGSASSGMTLSNSSHDGGRMSDMFCSSSMRAPQRRAASQEKLQAYARLEFGHAGHAQNAQNAHSWRIIFDGRARD